MLSTTVLECATRNTPTPMAAVTAHESVKKLILVPSQMPPTFTHLSDMDVDQYLLGKQKLQGRVLAKVAIADATTTHCLYVQRKDFLDHNSECEFVVEKEHKRIGVGIKRITETQAFPFTIAGYVQAKELLKQRAAPH